MGTRVAQAGVLDGLPVGVLVVRAAPPHEVTYRNPALVALLGEVPVGAPLDLGPGGPLTGRLTHPDGTAAAPDELPLTRVLASGEASGAEDFGLPDNEGGMRRVTACAHPLEGSVPAEVVLTLSPHAASSPTDAPYRRAFDASPLGALIARRDGRVLAMNPAYRRIIGLPPTMASEALQHNIATLDVYREAGLQPYIDAMLDGTAFEREIRLSSIVGEDVWVAYTGVPLLDEEGHAQGALLLLRDVATDRQMERRLRQAEAMEATARLAGGVAHDINNTMTAVAGYAELLLAQETEPRKRRYLGQVADAAAQVTHVVGALGRLRLRASPPPGSIDLAEAVWKVASAWARRAPPGIELDMDVAAGAMPVRLHREHLADSLEQLFANAVDAMPKGGQLTIQVARATPRAGLRLQFPSLPDARCAVIRVTDSGIGIPAERLHRVFEPYASTKAPTERKGLGLGLALVYAFVTESGGGIVVRSKQGKGTRVEITLPLGPPVA